MTKENKEKLLRKVRNKYRTGQYKTTTDYRSALNSIYAIDLKANPTKCELIVKEYLEEKNIRFCFQKGFMNPFHRIPDFYLPKRKGIIEVDGAYHNNTKHLDKHKDEMFLYHRGFQTLRITNAEVLNGTFKEKIDAFINKLDA